MPVESSVEVKNALRPTFDLSIGGRIKMVALGYIPFVHLCCSVALVSYSAIRYGSSWAIGAVVFSIYLLPPLAVRLARPSAMTSVNYPLGSAGFLKWWYSSQWQVIYGRFPALEELLRTVPGLYSAWLRLWGAKIGAIVYWSPGIKIFDRPFLEIGDRVVIGADTKITPHYLARSADGEMELVLSTVSIGHDAMIGGSTLLPAGVHVDPGEQTPGFKPMAPFAVFRDGQHIRTTRFAKDVQND